MGGRLDRDMNRRFNTTALNLASVRRARKRYSFTRSLTYTFSVLGAFLKRVLDFPADWMPLSKPYQHKPHVSLCFTRLTPPRFPPSVCLTHCQSSCPAPVRAKPPSPGVQHLHPADNCILSVPRPQCHGCPLPKSWIRVPWGVAPARLSQPSAQTCCPGSLLAAGTPTSLQREHLVCRECGGRGLPAARGLLQRCPPSRCAPVSRARSRQASLQIPRQHRLCPTATTRRCHITYGMLMPCCALAAPLLSPPSPAPVVDWPSATA